MMKLKTPTSLVAHYKIATPMFLGGEDQKADSAQFRNASFKGALRFWWRALNWGAALKHAGNQEKALLLLHEREGELFGLASDGSNSKQSRVQIHSELRGATVKQTGTTLNTVSYLLGQGLFNFPNRILRPYLDGGTLTITLIFKPSINEQDIASVQQAAIALGLFGGLGSRSRKGLGSLALQKIEREGHEEQRFTSEESIQKFIKSLDFSAPADAPLSALTRATRIDISTNKNSALDALAAINTEQQLYRSYGQNGMVGNRPARPNFIGDHDNVRAAIGGALLKKLPERAVFGLPHNYFFSSIKQGLKELKINAENVENKEKEGRRASPLLVHIHALGNGQYIAIQTLLHSQFLAPGMGAKTTPGGRIADAVVDFSVITRYMDGFDSKKTLQAAQP